MPVRELWVALAGVDYPSLRQVIAAGTVSFSARVPLRNDYIISKGEYQNGKHRKDQ